MTNHPVSKPGAHGPLFLYEVEYTDEHDDACPTFRWRAWAYSVEHALEIFYDADEGWTAKRIARVKVASKGADHRDANNGVSRHRWNWEACS